MSVKDSKEKDGGKATGKAGSKSETKTESSATATIKSSVASGAAGSAATKTRPAIKAPNMQASKKPLNTKKLLALGAVIIVIIAAIYLSNRSSAVAVSTAPVAKSDIELYVSAPAKVSLPTKAELNFKTPGKIAQVYAKKGDTVYAGDTLAELDMRSIYPQVGQAEAGLKLARANLEKLLAGSSRGQVRVAEASVKQASVAIKNAQKNLTDAKKIVETTRKKAKLSTSSQSYALDSAKESLTKLKSGLRANETKLARLTRDQATQSYDDALANYDKAQNTASALESEAEQAVSNAKATFDAYCADNTTDTSSVYYNQYKASYESATKALDRVRATNAQTLGSAESALSAAEKAYAQAQAQYDITTSGARDEDLNVAENQVRQAEIALELAKLSESDPSLNSQLDAAQSQLDSAVASSEVAIAQLQLTKEGPRAADVKAVKAQIEQAQSALDSAQTLADDQVLKAPFTGKVAAVSGKKGEIASQAAPLITLLNFDRIELTADVDETDVGKLKVGDDTKVTLDAFENKTLKGKVSNISLLSAKNATGGTIFEVTIIVDPQKETLREGMTGDVDIIVDSKKQVLTVPFESVKSQDNKSTVMVVENGKAKLKTIKTGLASDTSYEVTKGLSLGDSVITSKTMDIKEGQEVKIDKDGRIGQ